jgi:diguanylate cyclase (GGDEF)-like protein
MHIEDGLDKLLLGQYDEALSVFADCRPLPQAEKLYQITRMLTELSAYATELSKVNLAVTVPNLSNYPATSLKMLHSKLTRFARQLLMATTGYPVSSIDYMGDLSAGLDFLVSQALLYTKRTAYDRDHDTETGLLNRKAFVRKVYDILQEQPNKVGVLFCCMLDNIKYINETHGYDCGDLYISKIVEVLRACENALCMLARVGGNEFAVYAHGFATEGDAYGFARDIFKALFNTRVTLPHEEVKIRASCGVALYPHDATTSDVLMRYASHAMFEVHSLNRGTIMRFSPEIYRTKTDLFSRQERLDELIEGKLIHFALQPIVSLRDAKVAGYEALMRPKTDVFTGPLDILSLAEAQSKLSQLERVTFEVVFEWVFNNIELLGDKKVFFNTISVQYLDVAELSAIHPQYEMISKNMVFEIMETATIESNLLERVNDFRKELSTSIAIDDFGCGHSNALRLISISPDILKIDRFFINGIHSAPATKKELLSNILAYCRAKGILTLAEGVEIHEELAGVIRMGFDYAQGFYLGRPKLHLADIDPDVQAEIVALAAQDE